MSQCIAEGEICVSCLPPASYNSCSSVKLFCINFSGLRPTTNLAWIVAAVGDAAGSWSADSYAGGLPAPANGLSEWPATSPLAACERVDFRALLGLASLGSTWLTF